MQSYHAEIIKRLKRHYPNAHYYLSFSTPLELLVAAILSAQVKDEIVNAVTPILFKKYKSAEDYANTPISEIERDISSITFYKNKAKNIRATCKIIIEKHNGNVPNTIEELTSLPGIARKTANVILANAFNIISGIPVDTHYIRLAYRLGLTSSHNPVIIEKDSMRLIPKQYWSNLPHLLKAHGRLICKAPNPYCSKCFLNDICPKKGVIKQL